MDKLRTLVLVERLKTSDFILESKMAGLNQNKKLNDVVRKLCFTLEINEQHI